MLYGFNKNCNQNYLRKYPNQCASVITCKISKTEVILLFTVCQVLELTAHTANYMDHLQLQLKSYRKAAAAFSVSTKGRQREEWIYFSGNCRLVCHFIFVHLFFVFQNKLCSETISIDKSIELVNQCGSSNSF